MRYAEKHRIVLENCDGYSQIDDESIKDSYKKAYHWVERDGNLLLPFIYIVTRKTDSGFIEKCIVNIPRRKYIESIDGKKTIK
jgi:hypothetical protein